MRREKLTAKLFRLAAVGAVVAAVGTSSLGVAAPAAAQAGSHRARTPIQHFVFLMQADRSFDNYFSTYPGANGAPAGVCQRLVLKQPQVGCVRPFALHGKKVAALAAGNTVLDNQYDGGKLDAFVAAYGRQGRDGTDAMGYYDRRDLPYYWSVADQYVLFDSFFASARHGIRTNRSFWVSAAVQPGGADTVGSAGYGGQQTIFDELQAAGVSWKFYVEGYNPKETFRSRSSGNPASQTARVPLLNYARFVDDPALRSHIVDLSQYYRDLAAGTLPAVSYVASSGSSERSARSIPAGQHLVQRMVTQLMLSSAWRSTALMWSYDGSGGWFDHVPSPRVDGAVLGARVPALLISPYAKQGVVDHTQLDYTSALRFVEDNWSIRPLTSRDRSANSIAGALDLDRPARPAVVIGTAQPPMGARVNVTIAYLGYALAAGLAAVLLIAAGYGPSVVRKVRRRRAAWMARNPDRVLTGRVLPEDK
jgi:phospholipase C